MGQQSGQTERYFATLLLFVGGKVYLDFGGFGLHRCIVSYDRIADAFRLFDSGQTEGRGAAFSVPFSTHFLLIINSLALSNLPRTTPTVI